MTTKPQVNTGISFFLSCNHSGFPRTAAEDQEGAAQPMLRAELQLQSGAALQAPVWREVSVQHQVAKSLSIILPLAD